jgi:2-iminobutanoate/2-iminopropanoate deaminase
MKKQPLTTENAPAALGPYSQAIRCGNLLFISGQVPLDPKTGLIVGTNTGQQTEQVLKNIQGILTEAKIGFDAVVKTTVFLKNMNDFGEFNAVYEKLMPRPYPARSTIEVARLPKDALIEIESIALCP